MFKIALFGISLFLVYISSYTMKHAKDFGRHCPSFPLVGTENWLRMTISLDTFCALFVLVSLYYDTLHKNWAVLLCFSFSAVIWIFLGDIYLADFHEFPCLSLMDIIDTQTVSFLLQSLLTLIVFGVYCPP